MGLFDGLTFEDGLDVEFPDLGADCLRSHGRRSLSLVTSR